MRDGVKEHTLHAMQKTDFANWIYNMYIKGQRPYVF